MRRIIMASATIAVLASTSLAGAQQRMRPPASQPLAESIDVPLDMEGGRPVVSLTVDGRGPYRFIIDSGAMATLVDTDLPAELGLVAVGRALAGDPSGGPAREVEIFEAPEIRLANGRFTDIRLIALDDAELWERLGDVRGVLSTGFMAGNVVTFDFAAGEMRISPGSLEDGDGSLSYADRQRPIPNLQIDVAGRTVSADIDTGNGRGLSLPVALQDSLSFAGELQADSARLLTSSMQMRRGQLEGTVRVAGVAFENPAVELQDGFPFANVGSQFLDGPVLEIDPANARLRLSRDAAAEPPGDS